MTLAATFLAGAKSRLLPASIPFRFFAAASVFHVALWAVLLAAGEHLPGFRGGPGPVLAALHLLTLGVLTTTAIGASVQLLPVAPPRLIPELGVVDTGILYHQSVYSAFGSTVAGQLQAMPSLHAGWAILIAVAVWQVASGWWRWLGVIHAALTVYVIAVTGNHYWADSIVAGVILLVILAAHRALRGRRSPATDLPPREESAEEILVRPR